MASPTVCGLSALLLDDFRSNNPAHYQKGFPWHPHRGIETITYVLAGSVAHGDSLGNTGTISGLAQTLSPGTTTITATFQGIICSGTSISMRLCGA